MEALRIKVTSNVANYKKEETIEHKSTYPLPPYATIIGAIHKACGYTEYHKMDISIQGKYGSMGKKVYTNHWFLNSILTDRDYLVKIRDKENLSNSFEKVAYFGERKDVFKAIIDSNEAYTKESFAGSKIYNQKLADEYISLKKLEKVFDEEKKTIYDPKVKVLKDELKTLKAEMKNASSENKELLKIKIEAISLEVDNIENERKAFKEANITEPLSFFKTLNTSLKSYELLYDIELCLHISSDEETLKTIEENIFNLTAIGRSEDFIELKEIKRVKLTKDFDEVKSENSFYIDVNEIKEDGILPRTKTGVGSGTVYYINKDYVIENNKRKFNKVRVLYCSDIVADGDCANNIFVDDDNMIVSLM